MNGFYLNRLPLGGLFLLKEVYFYFVYKISNGRFLVVKRYQR